MKTRKTFAFVALCCGALWVNAQKLTSPDGNLVMDFSLNSKGAPQACHQTQYIGTGIETGRSGKTNRF